jgi:hypothetical protein
MSPVQKEILHRTKDSEQKTEVSKNNVLQIRPCAKNAGKGLFALISIMIRLFLVFFIMHLFTSRSFNLLYITSKIMR